VLLDTGFLVASVNDRDRAHHECVAISKRVQARVATVEGVLVETFYMLRGERDAFHRAIDLVQRWNVALIAPSLSAFRFASSLMRRYRRMDLVDGLLVAAAETLGTRRILTLDRRDFSVYRLSGNRAFDIVD
jgi:predicted nucleic acid-binding protein